jgi:hypothetical protein
LPIGGVAHREDVLLGEVDVKIAIRVRRVREKSVADSGIEDTLVVEGLVGLGDFGKFLEFLPVPRPGDVLRQPEARVFLGDEKAYGAANPAAAACRNVLRVGQDMVRRGYSILRQEAQEHPSEGPVGPV